MDTVKAPHTAELGAPQLEENDLVEHQFSALVMEERNRLKEIFKDPAFVKAWRNLRAVKPGVFMANATTLAGPTGAQLANNRLHEIRGWEMFSAALINQCKEPVVKRKPVTEDYPDEGTIDAEMRRKLPPTPPPTPVSFPATSGQQGKMPVASTGSISKRIRKTQ